MITKKEFINKIVALMPLRLQNEMMSAMLEGDVSSVGRQMVDICYCIMEEEVYKAENTK